MRPIVLQIILDSSVGFIYNIIVMELSPVKGWRIKLED